jgi:hypothetical protein
MSLLIFLAGWAALMFIAVCVYAIATTGRRCSLAVCVQCGAWFIDGKKLEQLEQGDAVIRPERVISVLCHECCSRKPTTTERRTDD